LPSGEDPETFAINSQGTRMYVSNEDDNQVTVIDLSSKQAIQQVAVGVEPEGIAVSPDGKWVVSASETTNMVHWIDAASNEIKAKKLCNVCIFLCQA
jgi:YVTN family beta-propeller protein